MKRVGICPFNSRWLACWGRDVPKRFANNSVVCSGSTLGHHAAVVTYAETMIGEFDSQQCHASRGIESDQGYHNYLFDTGKFAEKGLRIRANPQVRGVRRAARGARRAARACVSLCNEPSGVPASQSVCPRIICRFSFLFLLVLPSVSPFSSAVALLASSDTALSSHHRARAL